MTRPNGRPLGRSDYHGRCVRRVDLAESQRWWIRIGAAVRRAREDADIAASELAAALDVDTSAIHNWEAGRTRVPPLRLYQIAQSIGVPVEHLLPEEAP